MPEERSVACTSNDDVSRNAVQCGQMGFRGVMSKTLATVWGVVSSALVILGILNLFDLIDWLENLSSSLHWLVGWWRFIVASFFALLDLKLSELTQTILALIAIATSAAAAYSAAIHRRSAVGFVLKRAYERMQRDDRPWEWKTGEELNSYEPIFFDEEDLVALFIYVIGMIAAAITLCEDSELIRKIMIGSLCAMLVFALLVKTGFYWPVINSVRHRLKIPRAVSVALITVPVIPVALLFLVPAVIAPFKRASGWIVGCVVVMLVGNWLAVNFLDPVIPLLKNLPAAPPPPVLG